MYNKILSPVDGSLTSDRGVTEAIRLARDQQARLRFLHVLDPYFATVEPGSINIAEWLEILRRSGREILDKAKAAADAAGITAETAMVESMGGRVAEVIVREAQAWPAEVIVMGTHGRRGVSHLFMGSDAEAVIRTSPVPVLLMRYNQAEAKAAV